MKRYIKSESHTDRPSLRFYHYDNRAFNIGDIITGNHYPNKYPKIFELYSKKNPQIHKISDALYMYDSEVPESFEVYTYGYEVNPDCIIKRYSDYSFVMCISYMDKIIRKFSSIDDEDSRNFMIYQYIDLMSDAYLGNFNAITKLNVAYGIGESDAIEYISNSGEIIRQLVDTKSAK